MIREAVPRLVLDANVMVSALLGLSFPLFFQLFEGGVDLFAPVQQLAETRRTLLARPGLDERWADEQMRRLLALIQPVHPALIEPYETDARFRLGERGQPDWPVLATWLATGAGVWSRDKDLVGTGAPIWSTWVLRRLVARETAT